MTTDFNSINDITSWYQEVLWALKLDSFHLIGASRGGGLPWTWRLTVKEMIATISFKMNQKELYLF
ncbi:MAG TPA: hypothetical protein VKY45_01185 [Marinilabiliaceae bacterium]|nr:hypothetical protein [Marinilabiliaceae bacterium]